MRSPFPGMDPYLEHPEIWPGVHHRLIVAIADLLSVQLRPKYSVCLDIRLCETSSEESLVVSIPKLSARSKLDRVDRLNWIPSPAALLAPEIKPSTVTLPVSRTLRQGYLDIIEVETKQVVTSVELLSHANKRLGKERDRYIVKREQILGSWTNFVEIDLLRFGEPISPVDPTVPSHYQILVSRAADRKKADLYAFTIHDKIPSFPLPLRPEDTEPAIYLRDYLTDIYEIGGYELKIDYTQEPVPKLSQEDAASIDTLLRWQGMR